MFVDFVLVSSHLQHPRPIALLVSVVCCVGSHSFESKESHTHGGSIRGGSRHLGTTAAVSALCFSVKERYPSPQTVFTVDLQATLVNVHSLCDFLHVNVCIFKSNSRSIPESYQCPHLLRSSCACFPGKWDPPIAADTKQWIVQRTAGYCGADLKAFCAEATLVALRRAYPQVYSSTQRLDISASSLRLSIGDFEAALQKLVPASQRSTGRAASAIDPALKPLLGDLYVRAMKQLALDFPPARPALHRQVQEENKLQSLPLISSTSGAAGATNPSTISGVSSITDAIISADYSDMYEDLANGDDETWAASMADVRMASSVGAMQGNHRTAYHPRLLLEGTTGAGQTEIACGILACLEGIPCYSLDIPTLLTDTVASSAEQALLLHVQAAIRAAPAVVYLADVSRWWRSASEAVQNALLVGIQSISPDAPLLWIATADTQDLHALASEEEDPYAGNRIGLVKLLSWLKHGEQGSSIGSTHVLVPDGSKWLGSRSFACSFPSEPQRRAFFQPFFDHLPGLPSRVLLARKNILMSSTRNIAAASKMSDTSSSSNQPAASNAADEFAGSGVTAELHKSWQLEADKNLPRRSTRNSAASAMSPAASASAAAGNKKGENDSKSAKRNNIYKGNYNGDLSAYRPFGPTGSDVNGSASNADHYAADERDAYHLRELRTFLRNCLTELIKDQRCRPFARPVDPENVLDYYDVIQCPMDLETMRSKVGDGLYPSLSHFLRDLDQIVFNAQEYNPCTLKDVRGRQIVAQARAMADVVESYAYRFKRTLGYDLFRRCDEICSRRRIPSPPPAMTTDKQKVKYAGSSHHAEDKDTREIDFFEYYEEILAVHEELKAEYGDEHPTVLKEQEEIEKAEAAAEALRIKDARKAERDMEKLRRRQQGEDDGDEEEHEAGDGGIMGERTETGKLLRSSRSSTGDALAEALASSNTHYLAATVGLDLSAATDDDPEAFFKRRRREENKRKAELKRLTEQEEALRMSQQSQPQSQEQTSSGAEAESEMLRDRDQSAVLSSQYCELQEVQSFEQKHNVHAAMETEDHVPAHKVSPSKGNAASGSSSTSSNSIDRMSNSVSANDCTVIINTAVTSSAVETKPLVPERLPPLTEENINALPSMALLSIAVSQAAMPQTVKYMQDLLHLAVQLTHHVPIASMKGLLARMQREVLAYERGYSAGPYDWNTLVQQIQLALS